MKLHVRSNRRQVWTHDQTVRHQSIAVRTSLWQNFSCETQQHASLKQNITRKVKVNCPCTRHDGSRSITFVMATVNEGDWSPWGSSRFAVRIEFHLTFGKKKSGFQSLSGCLVIERNLLPLSGIDLSIFGRPHRSLVSITNTTASFPMYRVIRNDCRDFNNCYLVLHMQSHVISFYGVTSRIKFMFLLFQQVTRNWRYESEPPLKPSLLTCYKQFGTNSIIVLMFVESQRVHM